MQLINNAPATKLHVPGVWLNEHIRTVHILIIINYIPGGKEAWVPEWTLPDNS